jgi:hypothetical protein
MMAALPIDLELRRTRAPVPNPRVNGIRAPSVPGNYCFVTNFPTNFLARRSSAAVKITAAHMGGARI